MRLIILILIMGLSPILYADQKISKLSYDTLLVMYGLWQDSGFGKDPNKTERAAWIVKDAIGAYRLIHWPRSCERNREFWYGPVPRNTIAQIHTHTDKSDPRPATKDIALARRICIPIYTISGSGIWRAKSDGVVERVTGKRWYAAIQHLKPPVKIGYPGIL